MAFDRIQRDPQSSRRHARAFDELRELRVDAEPRILEADGVDRVRRDRNLDPCVVDDALAIEGNQSREAEARLAVVHPIEVNPADLLTFTIRVHDARAQAARHEGKM